jgi:hypothetical protein
MPVRLRQGYGATVFALLHDASEDWRQGDYAPASASDTVPLIEFCLHAFGFGGKGIRTPDFQLAKLALYQLSYAPAGTPNAFACSRLLSELTNVDF